jgi:hypothetical protein
LGAGLECSCTKQAEPEVFECLHEWFFVCIKLCFGVP